jgi:hypothetical protein
MVYAFNVESETRRSCTRMLDELDRALTSAAEGVTRNKKRVERHWTNFIKELLIRHVCQFSIDAVQCGLSLCVAEKCQSGHIKWIKGQRPLLDFILVDNPFIYNSEAAKVLIQYGANPNMRFQGDTLWKRGLRNLYYAQQSEGNLRMERWQRTLDVVEALVRGGADPRAHFKHDIDLFRFSREYYRFMNLSIRRGLRPKLL